MVGHSLGGLIARYYVTRLGGDQRVHTLVTLGTPHAAPTAPTPCPHALCRQLRPGSGLMRELAEPVPGCRTRFLAYWSDLDQMVLPQDHARLEHPDLAAHNIEVHGLGHMSLPISGRVVHGISTALAHLDPDGSTVAAGVAYLAGAVRPEPPSPAGPAGTRRDVLRDLRCRAWSAFRRAFPAPARLERSRNGHGSLPVACPRVSPGHLPREPPPVPAPPVRRTSPHGPPRRRPPPPADRPVVLPHDGGPGPDPRPPPAPRSRQSRPRRPRPSYARRRHRSQEHARARGRARCSGRRRPARGDGRRTGRRSARALSRQRKAAVGWPGRRALARAKARQRAAALARARPGGCRSRTTR